MSRKTKRINTHPIGVLLENDRARKARSVVPRTNEGANRVVSVVYIQDWFLGLATVRTCAMSSVTGLRSWRFVSRSNKHTLESPFGSHLAPSTPETFAPVECPGWWAPVD